MHKDNMHSNDMLHEIHFKTIKFFPLYKKSEI